MMPDSYSWTLGGAISAPSIGICGSATGRLVMAKSNAYISLSDDEGVTWYDANSTLIATGGPFKTSTGRILISSQENKINYSDDNGLNWSSDIVVSRYVKYFFQSLNGRIFAFSTNNAGMALYSDDDGLSWSQFFMAVNAACMIEAPSGRLFAFDALSGNYSYSDTGISSWISTQMAGVGAFYTAGVAQNGNLIAFTSDAGVKYSTDSGLSWGDASANIATLSVGSPSGKMFYGTDSGFLVCGLFDGLATSELIYSIDNGLTWENDSVFSAQNKPAYSLYVDEATDYLIYGYDTGTYLASPTYITYDLALDCTDSQDICMVSCIPPSYILPHIPYELGNSEFVDVMEQYKQSDNLLVILNSILAQADEVQKATLDMSYYQYLANAFGTTLDMIGSVFNVERHDLNDSEYRTQILARSANRGQITPNELIRILKGFYGASSVLYLGARNGTMILATEPAMDQSVVESLVGAGVGVELHTGEGVCLLYGIEAQDTCAISVQNALEIEIDATEAQDTAISNVVISNNITIAATEQQDTMVASSMIGDFMIGDNEDYMVGNTGDYMVGDIAAWALPESENNMTAIEYSEVSMLCIDGSDGKNNSFTITALSDDGEPLSGVTWWSEDSQIATVSGDGSGVAIVSGVGVGGSPLGADVRIYAEHRGIEKSCLFTIYATMPSADVEGAGLWLLKGGSGLKSELDVGFFNIASFSGQVPMGDFLSTRLVEKYHVAFGAYAQHMKNGESSVYINPAHPISPFPVQIAKMQGVTEYTYRSDSPQVPGANYTKNIIYRPSGYSENGISIPTTLYATYTRATGYHNLDFGNLTFKIVLSAMSKADETPGEYSELCYVPQNYVRFTDGVGQTNRTKILNIGTLGSAYDLEANNVPVEWFAV